MNAMGAPETGRLLAFARELQRAATFEELLLATQAELEAAMGYKHAWLFVADKEDVEEMRLIDVAGSVRDDAWVVAPVLKIKGDPMLEEIVRSDRPVVVADARTDPRTNKQIVEQLQNRTILDPDVAYLQKPLVPDAFARRVREVLDTPKRGTRIPPPASEPAAPACIPPLPEGAPPTTGPLPPVPPTDVAPPVRSLGGSRKSGRPPVPPLSSSSGRLSTPVRPHEESVVASKSHANRIGSEHRRPIS
jgi:hypothetical protein